MKKLLLTSLMLFTITTGTQGSERRIARQKMGCWALCMLALARITGTAADYPLCERQDIAAQGSELGGSYGIETCVGLGYDEPNRRCGNSYRLYEHVGSPDIWLSENPDTRCGPRGSCPPLSSSAEQLKKGAYINQYSRREYAFEGVARDHASCREYAVYTEPNGKGLYALPVDTFTKIVSVYRQPVKELPLFAYEEEVCKNQRIALPGHEWGGPDGMSIRICTTRDYSEPCWGCESRYRWVCEGGYRVAQHIGSPDFWLSEDVSTTRCVQKEKACPLSSHAAQLKTGTYTNIYDEREYKLLGVARDHASCKEYALYEGEGGSFREDKGVYAMPLGVFTSSVTLRSGFLSIEKPLFKYKEQE